MSPLPSRFCRASVAAALVVCATSTVAPQEMELISPGATVKRVATGFGFLEGPVADPIGNLYFTDIPNSRIHRWSADNGVTLFRDGSGRANGLRLDADNTLVVCEMQNRRVVVLNPTGRVTVLAAELDGRRFNSPNDLWIDPSGGIYSTDPRYGPNDDREMDGEHVYYITPKRDSVRQVTDDLVRPNGIIGAHDGSRVYIADHGAGQTYVYMPAEDGTLTNKRLFVPQGADGMTIDKMGNVYLTGSDITIYNPDGALVVSIAIPEPPANLTFSGTTLFITARTSLYALEMAVTGQ